MHEIYNIRQALLNDALNEKLELLRSIVGINVSIVVATVGLVFILYQIDRYSKFKQIRYLHMICYILLSIGIGLGCPVILMQITGSAYTQGEANIYVLSVFSPFVVIILSSIYLGVSLRVMSTKNTIHKFKYKDKLSVSKLKEDSISLYDGVIQRIAKKTEKKPRRNKDYRIGREDNPVATLASAICIQHGVVMQEWDATKLSNLSTRDDLLVRMAATALEIDDSKILRQIIARYAELTVSGSKDFFSKYSEDLESIGALLIRHKRNDLYELLIDDLSQAWMKDEESFKNLDDKVGRLYAGILYQYIDKGDDFDSVQKSAMLLMNFYFLILGSKSANVKKDWFYASDATRGYVQKSILRIAEKGQEYNLWLMHEKANYYAHHGAEVNKVGITTTYMKLLSNIGIAGRVYSLHCGATDCSKTTYEHAVETFEELEGYYKDTFSKEGSKQFIVEYKESFEKLLGYEVKLELENRKYTIDKDKPKRMHAIKIGPTKSTSDSEAIDYSNLDKVALRRLMLSRKAGW